MHALRWRFKDLKSELTDSWQFRGPKVVVRMILKHWVTDQIPER